MSDDQFQELILRNAGILRAMLILIRYLQKQGVVDPKALAVALRRSAEIAQPDEVGWAAETLSEWLERDSDMPPLDRMA